jgi:CBS domain containing-hemolysin-like protein
MLDGRRICVLANLDNTRLHDPAHEGDVEICKDWPTCAHHHARIERKSWIASAREVSSMPTGRTARSITASSRSAASIARGAAALAAFWCANARASFLSGDALDAVADVMAWVVIVIVPIIGIVVFWLVHVLPEKIAHKRHHPQTAAIQTLCLLSLVFGGLLWPIAWLWAYTRPVFHKMAYGTDKHEDHFAEIEARLHAGELTDAQLAQLQSELAAMERRGHVPPGAAAIREADAPGGARSD